MKLDYNKRIRDLGLILPPSPKPAGAYMPIVQVSNLLYVSGHLPMKEDGSLMTGRLGESLTVEEGKTIARQVGINMLATLRNYLGDLNKIERLVKTMGIVNCTADFDQQPAVINGFSELMIDIFGEENGKGTRSAFGAILPLKVAVEIEAVFLLK
ncbi:MAG: RidA family protein [Bacteroidales bacterium]|jgi:enamine deaminase RidA (YjgF/YER057c/UK114 family)